jgi:hypothetical protein
MIIYQKKFSLWFANKMREHEYLLRYMIINILLYFKKNGWSVCFLHGVLAFFMVFLLDLAKELSFEI